MQDNFWMEMAFRVGLTAIGRSSPNPPVGAVIVKNNRLISTGATMPVGGAHAEVVALEQAGTEAKDATLYVTLEPCSFHGRTPACTLAIQRAQIKRVVIAIEDMHPQVSGQGIAQLRAQGIECVILEKYKQRAHSIFHPFFSAGNYYPGQSMAKPEYILKAALTLDGFVATHKKDSKWITSDFSRQIVHRLRSMCDAILVGVGTVHQDDPQLNVRLNETNPFLKAYYNGGIPYQDEMVRLLLTERNWPLTKNPIRIVLDPVLRISGKSKIMQSASVERTVLFAAKKKQKGLLEKARRLEKKGAEIRFVSSMGHRLSIEEINIALLEMGMLRVLVEGGAGIYKSFYQAGWIDRFFLFWGNKILQGGDGLPLFPGRGSKEISRAKSIPNPHLISYPDFVNYLQDTQDINFLLTGGSDYVYGNS